MAINDLYHVQLIQTVLGKPDEELITNYFYNGVTIATTAISLAESFRDLDMLPNINAVQSHNIQNKSIKVFNLFSLTDFAEVEASGEGAQAGEMLPVFCGLSFSKKLDTRGVRPGRVNIPGVPEAVTNLGIITDATYISGVNTLIGVMVDDINKDADEIYDPVVIKRIKEEIEDDDGPTGRYSYRLPANLGEANFGHVMAILWKRQVAHAVQRGNGR